MEGYARPFDRPVPSYFQPVLRLPKNERVSFGMLGRKSRLAQALTTRFASQLAPANDFVPLPLDCFPHPPSFTLECSMPTTGERFERAVAIMERLRAPGGCPWDREQTFDSIKPYTLEETYEVLEAIDNRDWPELAGELGDLLLQVLFYAEMAKEQSS